MTLQNWGRINIQLAMDMLDKHYKSAEQSNGKAIIFSDTITQKLYRQEKYKKEGGEQSC